MMGMPFGYPAHALRITRTVGFASMAAEDRTNSSPVQSENAPPTLGHYPVPLSPPPPLLSKNVELSRALTASSKSSLLSLSRNDVLFEDEWLIAVNKPCGIYCESVLSSVRTLMSSDQGSVIPGIGVWFDLRNFSSCSLSYEEVLFKNNFG